MRVEILGQERRRLWRDEQKLEIVMSVGINGAAGSPGRSRSRYPVHPTWVRDARRQRRTVIEISHV
jgi:transposase